MGHQVIRQFLSHRFQLVGLFVFVLAGVIYCLSSDHCSVLTADQKGYRLYERGAYEQAAKHFSDPFWKGVSLFKQGEFKQAAGVFVGYDTAEAAFNHGNALVMMGKYDDAIKRYDRALELKPDWEAAAINRDIARGRAKFVEKKGGDMTGGKMEADEIVFGKGKSPPSSTEEQVIEEQGMGDAEMRAVWLRNVQTKPADFLRAKFAYQHAMRNVQAE